MIKIGDITEEIQPKEIGIPKVLFHATFEPYLKSIRKKGLGGSNIKNHKDSIDGIVYLVDNIDDAITYAEDSETVPYNYLDKVIVLKIETNKLDETKLIKEQLPQVGLGDIYQYSGIIPIEDIKVVK